MARRIVYSPRVWAYTKNSTGSIYDISPYITAGSVNRLVNQVSTATVTLRNPKKIFTSTSDHGAAFHPMDPITIFMQRLAGHPTRVFTGYLDETPYYQMFPGTITLQASCTLKKLLYQFFDPALPYVNSFLAYYGWTNLGNGSIVANQAYTPGAGGNSAATGSQTPLFGKDQLNDGSISRLLHAVLTQIGSWDDSRIYIEALPTTVPARMAALMKEFKLGNTETQSEYNQFMNTVMGTGSYGSGGATSGTTPTTPTGGYNQQTWAIALLQSLGVSTTSSNIQAIIGWENAEGGNFNNSAKYNPLNTTQDEPGATNTGSQGNIKAYISWAQGLQATVATLKNGKYSGILSALQTGTSASAVGAAIGASPWGTSASLVASTIASAPSNVVNNDAGAGVSGNIDTIQTGATGNTPSSTSTATASTVRTNIIDNANGWVGKPPAGPKYENNFGPNEEWCALFVTYIWQQAGIKIPTFAAVGGLQMWAQNNNQFRPASATPLVGDAVIFGTVHTAIVGNVGSDGTLTLINGDSGNNDVATSVLGPGSATTQGYPADLSGFASPLPLSDDSGTTVVGISGTSSTGGVGTGGSSTGDMASQAAASAFTTTIDFPSIQDMVAAQLLQGDKALMNDQSLMPFMQQLCQASMRSFQSLPNGDFFAFYPDYFGEMGHNTPYWYIGDIETLDGDIYLNDANLATHVYAVGDNSWPINDELVNQLFSAGTVTIFNAFDTAGSAAVVDQSTSQAQQTVSNNPSYDGTFADLMDNADALSFIQRYGARPVETDYPMVRSPIFEMLLAYQNFSLAWSRQFITPFTFTFMPELFPGGKVGFPDHGLQMYIESVTHSWDMQSGFTTTANLSAPALMAGVTAKDYPDLPPNMVAALLEPIQAMKTSSTPKAQPASSISLSSLGGTANTILGG